MTSIPFNNVWGPNSIGATTWITSSVLLQTALDDADDAYAWVFAIPFSGLITDIGFLLDSVTGNPPAYNFGITTVADATGNPDQTPYGGSTIETLDYTNAGWKWITLTSGAVAVPNDVVAVHAFPTASAPDVSNNIAMVATVGWSTSYNLPRRATFSTTWGNTGGHPYNAIKYSDGRVWGFPITAHTPTLVQAESTYDEMGDKFVLPFDAICAGPSIQFDIDAAGDEISALVRLYDNSDAVLREIYIADLDEYLGTLLALAKADLFWQPITLYKDATYRLTVRVLTSGGTSDITLQDITFNSAADKNTYTATFSGWSKTARKTDGSWTDTETNVIPFGLYLSSIEVVTGSGTGTAGGAYAYIG